MYTNRNDITEENEISSQDLLLSDSMSSEHLFKYVSYRLSMFLM
jgi:hypothetical protein